MTTTLNAGNRVEITNPAHWLRGQRGTLISEPIVRHIDGAPRPYLDIQLDNGGKAGARPDEVRVVNER